MVNVTSRLAVSIRYLPDFYFRWSDDTPQRSCDSTTIEDISPSELDVRVLKAIRYIMEFLVTVFPNLSDQRSLFQPLHPVKKYEVVPMVLLLKDEKYKSETIEIITQLYCDAGLSGNH